MVAVSVYTHLCVQMIFKCNHLVVVDPLFLSMVLTQSENSRGHNVVKVLHNLQLQNYICFIICISHLTFHCLFGSCFPSILRTINSNLCTGCLICFVYFGLYFCQSGVTLVSRIVVIISQSKISQTLDFNCSLF